MYDHIRQAQNGKRGAKCERIREIVSSGRGVKCQIIQRFHREADAYAAEAKLIAQIGLHRLTNLLPDGQGAWSLAAARARSRWTVALFSRMAPRLVRAWLREGTLDLWLPGDFYIGAGLKKLLEEIATDLGAAAFWQCVREAMQRHAERIFAAVETEMRRRRLPEVAT